MKIASSLMQLRSLYNLFIAFLWDVIVELIFVSINIATFCLLIKIPADFDCILNGQI